jgi:peptide/nickel transport system permease protein
LTDRDPDNGLHPNSSYSEPGQVAGVSLPRVPSEEYRSQFRLALRALRRDRLALFGVIVILVVAIIAVAAPLISPYEPTESDFDTGRLAPVGSSGHLLGTDGQARDILTRLIWGSRVSIPTAVVPVLVSATAGLILGLIAGMATRRWIVESIMRSQDVLFAFPPVLLAIAMATVLGPGMMNLMLSISVVVTPFMARVVYVETVSVRSKEYVEAARAAGTPGWRLLIRVVVPNVLPPLIVYSTTTIGGLIVLASGLSFLGVGIQPPTADWGVMTADGRTVLREAAHVATIPGLTIIIVALAFNVAGDGIRDALDPQRRTG